MTPLDLFNQPQETPPPPAAEPNPRPTPAPAPAGRGSAMTREQAMRKAAALLRLADRPGTAGEAAAAVARAQEIMDRFELTAGAVEQYGQPAAVEPDEPIMSGFDVPEGWLTTAARRVSWHYTLARGVAGLHGCFVFNGRRGKGHTLEIVGRPSSAEAVRYQWAWLSVEIQRLCDRHGRGLGVAWRNNFCLGAVEEIVERLKASRATTVAAVRQESQGNASALVAVNNALARMDPTESRAFAYRTHRLVKGSGSSQQYNGDARSAGRNAARGINLGRSAGSLSSGARQIGGRS